MVNCFVPVMKASLETSLSERNKKSGKQVIMIDEFGEYEKQTVQLFVQILHKRKSNTIQNITWEELVKLLKMAHFFQCDVILKVLYNLGKMLINQQNIYEAISLMEILSFDHWHSRCIDILRSCNMRQLTETEDWKNTMDRHPKRVAMIMCEMVKQQGQF